MSACADGSWSKTSEAILDKYSIMDWPVWRASCGPGADYKCYVDGSLAKSYGIIWRGIVSRHRAHIPYYLFESSPGLAVSRLQSAALSVETQGSLRSWCRLRCGLLTLSHLAGRESAARHQTCIFCNECTRNAAVHCLSLCSRWADRRCFVEALLRCNASDGAQNFALHCMRSDISEAALESLVVWAADLDREASAFWHDSKGR